MQNFQKYATLKSLFKKITYGRIFSWHAPRWNWTFSPRNDAYDRRSQNRVWPRACKISRKIYQHKNQRLCLWFSYDNGLAVFDGNDTTRDWFCKYWDFDLCALTLAPFRGKCRLDNDAVDYRACGRRKF